MLSDVQKKEAIKKLKKDGYDFIDFPMEYKKDKDIVLQALKCSRFLFAHAHYDIRNDKEFVLKIINDEMICELDAVSQNLKQDRDVVLKAANKGCSLKDADIFLRDNKEIALSAVKNLHRNYKFISDKLKNDEEIVKEVMGDEDVIPFIPDVFFKEESFVMKLIDCDADNLKHASGKIKDNKDIVLECIKRNEFVIKHASERLQDDDDVVLEAVRRNGCTLEFASNRLKGDMNIVKIAIDSNPFAITYANEELKNDIGLVYLAVKKNINVLSDLPKIKEFIGANEPISFLKSFIAYIDINKNLDKRVNDNNKTIKI